MRRVFADADWWDQLLAAHEDPGVFDDWLEIHNSGIVPCPADVDGDGQVAVTDVLAPLAAWGQGDPDLDLDGIGIVDVGDLLLVIAAWGPCPS